jgi:hypothetical protein
MAYSQELINDVVDFIAAGHSHKEASTKFHIPSGNISGWIAKRRQAGEPLSTSKIPEVTSPTTQELPLTHIVMDAGTQMRERLTPATIRDYADAMSEGAKFPPIIAFSNGQTYWLADGFQRVKAAEVVGYEVIEAEVRQGTLRDAVLYACGANSTHGQRRTNNDKRKSVLTLLHDTEWVQWSDNKIAGVCGVSHTFVSEVRQSLLTINVASEHDSSTRQYTTRHGTTATMHTSRIGKRATMTQEDHQQVDADINGDNLTISYTPESTVAPEPSPAVAVRTRVLSEPTAAPILPTSCPTCNGMRPLIDEALAHLRQVSLARTTSGYQGCEQALLAMRALVQSHENHEPHPSFNHADSDGEGAA